MPMGAFPVIQTIQGNRIIEKVTSNIKSEFQWFSWLISGGIWVLDIKREFTVFYSGEGKVLWPRYV